MFFKGEAHQQRFLAAMHSSGKVSGELLNREYGAAIYILTVDPGLWHKAQTYVSREGVDIPALLADVDLSGGYGVLVRLAGNLLNSEVHLDPVELMRLDDEHFQVALTALLVRRVSVRLSTFKGV